jgi:hypothetical protein
MFKVDLEKELNTLQEKRMEILNEHTVIEDVNRLLANDGAQDAQILRDLGMDHQIKIASDQKEARLTIEKFVSENKGGVYTLEDIRKIACKFALKFLRTDNYKGAVDPVMIQKLKTYLKEKNMELSEARLGFNFFLLAPPESFNLKVVDRIQREPIDPVLFYKLDDNHYKMIHKWGNDFTWYRQWLGFKWRNASTHTWIQIAKLVGLMGAFLWFGIQFGKLFAGAKPGDINSLGVIYIIGSIVTTVALGVIFIGKAVEFADGTSNKWSQVWNNTSDLRR